MRLIDADAFKKYIEDGIDGLILPRDQVEKAIAITKGFLKDIDEQPTVERPHGEWVKKNTEFGGICWATCSVCKKISNGEGQDNGFGHDYFYPNFCPNCGADMREGDSDA